MYEISKKIISLIILPTSTGEQDVWLVLAALVNDQLYSIPDLIFNFIFITPCVSLTRIPISHFPPLHLYHFSSSPVALLSSLPSSESVPLRPLALLDNMS